MQFNFTDAWVIFSIHATEAPESGAMLKDIIAYADYIDHSVMTYAELSGALAKLLPLGLLLQLDKNLATTDLYKTWWESKYAGRKRIDISKALADVRAFLNDTYNAAELPEIAVEINIRPEDFALAHDQYLKSWGTV